MPRYNLSPEERVAEKTCREQLTTLIFQFGVKGLGDFRDLFKEMVEVFLLHSSIKIVSYKDIKAFMVDLKCVYGCCG
jgi:hypothetical protein